MTGSDDTRHSGAAAASRLRDRIDSGATGDKVAHPDPAAAPLGTDDEAAGHPPTVDQVREATRHETGRTRSDNEDGKGSAATGRLGVLLVGLAVGAILLIAWAILQG